MTTFYRVPMLRVDRCSDPQLWYARRVGELLPHANSLANEYMSREPGGYTNVVRHADATPVEVIVPADRFGKWPYWSHLAKPLVVPECKPASTCASACNRLGVCQALPDCADPVPPCQPEPQTQPPPDQPAHQEIGQSRRLSLLEAMANIVVGFVVSLAITAAVMPLFGHHVTAAQNVAITSIFTVASLLRGYALRRVFNHIHTGGAA